MEPRATVALRAWARRAAPPAARQGRAGSTGNHRSPDGTRGWAFKVLLAVALMISAGCASGPRSPETVASDPEIPAATWQSVERDILLASAVAKADAKAYASTEMDQWMRRVRQYTEENFIPWYTSYWTQEWLALKVAYYRSNDAEGDAVAVSRLARYLQEKFLSEVLVPAAEETDPSNILRQGTQVYVDALAGAIEAIGQRYQLPEKRFRNRLYQIPAISAEGALAPGVSVGRLIRSNDLATDLRPYNKLMEQIDSDGVDVNSRLSEGGLSPIASAVAETFVRKIATRGGAAAAAAVVGGPAGLAISLGITGFSVANHNKHEPELEAQMRAVLAPALEQMLHNLMDASPHGVLGAVIHINDQIEQELRTRRSNIEIHPYEGPSYDDYLKEAPVNDSLLYEGLW